MNMITEPASIHKLQVEIIESQVDLSKPSTRSMQMDFSTPSTSLVPMDDLSKPSPIDRAKDNSPKKNISDVLQGNDPKVIEKDDISKKVTSNNTDPDPEVQGSANEVSVNSSPKEIDMMNNLSKNTTDKSNNFDKNIPTPFKDALFWPDAIVKKNQKQKRSKEVIPSAITSTPWKEYWMNKKKKKEDEEKAKEERKRVREQKKAERETLQREKQAKQSAPTAKPKPKLKTKRRLFLESSDGNGDSDTSDPPRSPVSEVKEALELKNLKKDDYIIFLYEEEYFPGNILEVTNTGARVSAMTMAGPDGWRWPEKEDIFHYALSEIKEVIKPPTVRNNRGVWCVPEIAKYRT